MRSCGKLRKTLKNIGNLWKTQIKLGAAFSEKLCKTQEIFGKQEEVSGKLWKISKFSILQCFHQVFQSFPIFSRVVYKYFLELQTFPPFSTVSRIFSSFPEFFAEFSFVLQNFPLSCIIDLRIIITHASITYIFFCE